MSRPDDQCTICTKYGHRASQCPDGEAFRRSRGVQVLTLKAILAKCISEDALDEDACMNWQFSVSARGQPMGKHNGAMIGLRRLVWSLARDGEEVPSGRMVTIKCMNRRCLNPNHVVAVTRKECHQAWSAEGIYSTPTIKHNRTQGARSSKRCKLSREKAEQIRKLKGVMTAYQIAQQFGVTEDTIHGVWRGRSWTDKSIPQSSVFAWAAANAGRTEEAA